MMIMVFLLLKLNMKILKKFELDLLINVFI